MNDDDDARMGEAAKQLTERPIPDAELVEPRGQLSKTEANLLENPIDAAMRESLEDLEYEARVTRERIDSELASHLSPIDLKLVKAAESWAKAEAIASAALERKGWK